ncbi:MAG: AI-2E family transporter [Oscillospiraceae bacterium]|nr:AI-2E family transporter [Oscillospiraceae bacterium]
MKRQRREPIVLSQMRPITLFFVLAGCIALTFAFIRFDDVAKFVRKITSALAPVFAGFVFAYLLAPAASMLEKRFDKWLANPIRKHPKLAVLPRGLSSFLVVAMFIGSIVLLVIVTFSQVVNGLSTAIDQLPHYFNLIMEYVEKLLHADNTLAGYLRELQERFSATELGMGNVDPVDVSQKILAIVASGATSTLGFLYAVIVGFIIAVYLLVSRQRFVRQWKQILYALFKPKTADWIDKQMTAANQTFGTAAIGKLLDSLLIGMLCFIGVTIIGAPYTTLIAVIIGTTNMIPYFGPIFGAIPCTLLILMENPLKALYFLIFIIALQQFDANILDPRIVGQSIGLPAFWELFACLLGGGIFGIIGLIIGVPMFAVAYTLIRQVVLERLDERAKDGELTPEFLRDTLEIKGHIEDSGLFHDDESDSQYLQHLILLEDIAQKPSDIKETADELLHDLSE